ncbi:structural protein with Ig domain [Achromobacter phage phiAxp-3]|uniref:Kappa-carrageenase n=1 Tax=Achromobacter phage phiAxp-3 TaxID=1664247 RepID=A0A0K2FHC7_9CAUD|nr:structural protein with Ig domain [Achromobacter phage phiAxp-3]ALA45487.1 kappa-carrageenase precursor [Achromobacter phage phiAxp-3]
MSKYQVSWNPDTRVAKVQLDGATPGAGFTRMGTFDHPDPIYPDSLVMYQGVQKVLYRTKNSKPPVLTFFPDGITDMQRVSIVLDTAPVNVPVASITIAPTSANIFKGDAPTQLTATVLPADATNKGIEWSSSNNQIASVDETGKVTGNGAGNATITAKSISTPAVTKTAAVNVSVRVTGLYAEPLNISVPVGSEQQITTSVYPEDATNKNVTYTSADPAIATVTAAGLVKGVAPGETTVTVKTVDGGFNQSIPVVVS